MPEKTNPLEPEKKLCFVIGPMADMARLNRLADEVVRPVVEPLGYRVETPDQPDIGNIMNQVVEKLDRAELVVADLTGGNPNVFYELGIRHSLGLVHIAVKEERAGQPDAVAPVEKTPFDVAAYRYTAIDFENLVECQTQVRRAVEKATQTLEERRLCSNPVTDFYRAPMTEVNLAAGLAFGYYHNFVEPLALAIRDCDEQGNYVNEVAVDKVPVTETAVRNSLQLKVAIPETLEQVGSDHVSDLKKQFCEVKVVSPRRPFFLYAKRADPNQWIIDFPTTMNVMCQALMKRLGMSHPEYGDRSWRELERQQIAIFRHSLERQIQNNSRVRSRASTCDWDEVA